MEDNRINTEAAAPAGPPAQPGPPAAAAAPPTPEPGPSQGPPQGRGYGRGGWGRDIYHPFDPRRKSPLLASFLSIVPGLGQIYVGYYQAGFVHALVFGSIIVMMVNEVLDELLPLQGIFLGFFFLYNVIDAGRRAAFYNQALEGDETANVPKGQLSLGSGGSLVGGLFLIIVGGGLLANTALDISLAWVEDWWPVAPIIFGIYLVMQAMKERAAAQDQD